jgi:DNA-directed RNA polymerase subunit beta'
VDTTPGRMMLAELLPRPKVPVRAAQPADDQEGNRQTDRHVYRHCGQKETVIFCDRIMALGFKPSCKAGISFGKDDMVVPKRRKKLVDETASAVRVRAAVQ